MKTRAGQEMFLSSEAEEVAKALYAVGADFSSGHRDLGMAAHAMAENVCAVTYTDMNETHAYPVYHRDWIKATYLCPGPLQDIVDAHPEATTPDTLAPFLLDALNQMSSEEIARLSHHFVMPCPVFDLYPVSITENVKTVIADLQRQGKIVKVLTHEGGLVRYHIECASLPLNKVMQI